MRRSTTTTTAGETRDVRDARQAYACALAARLDDLLAEDDCDDHAAEAADIVESLSLLIGRCRLPAAGERAK